MDDYTALRRGLAVDYCVKEEEEDEEWQLGMTAAVMSNDRDAVYATKDLVLLA
jgi:hypothetical protein